MNEGNLVISIPLKEVVCLQEILDKLNKYTTTIWYDFTSDGGNASEEVLDAIHKQKDR